MIRGFTVNVSAEELNRVLKTHVFSLRKPKFFVSQILRFYLTKEGRVRKFFHCLMWIKEPCVRNFFWDFPNYFVRSRIFFRLKLSILLLELGDPATVI